MKENLSVRFWRSVKASVDAQEFPWLPPWRSGGDERERTVRRIRVAARRLIRAESIERNGARPTLIRCLAWPVLLPIKAWQAALIPGASGFWKRFVQGCVDLIFYNIRPYELLPVHALRSDNRRAAALYVSDLENQAILMRLNRSAKSWCLADKIIFAEFCGDHSLPHVPVVAHGNGAKVTQLAPWPSADLFAKPANLYGGKGAEMLVYNRDNHTWLDEQGRTVSPDHLVDWAAVKFGRQSWLIQPRIQVDPAWAQWSARALMAVRITTAIVHLGKPPELIFAYLRMPKAGMWVDNLHAGGLPANVDLETGRLGPLMTKRMARPSCDHHPDNGAAVAGVMVPGWAEMCKLACEAHAAAPDLMAVGWDIVIDNGAPVLLEANPVFNISSMVVLGETRWLEAVVHREAALTPID